MGPENHPYRTEHSQGPGAADPALSGPPHLRPGRDSCHPRSTELGATVTTGLGAGGAGRSQHAQGQGGECPHFRCGTPVKPMGLPSMSPVGT